jgi:hypothetical protein
MDHRRKRLQFPRHHIIIPTLLFSHATDDGRRHARPHGGAEMLQLLRRRGEVDGHPHSRFQEQELAARFEGWGLRRMLRLLARGVIGGDEPVCVCSFVV